MKMKNIKLIILTLVSVSFFITCKKADVGVDLSTIKDGNNIVVFENDNQLVTNIAESGAHTFDVKVKLTGPTAASYTGDITVTFAVDTASDAEEGVHYSLDNNSIVLKESENYLGVLPVTMLTDGVPSPLAKHLVLKISEAKGDNVVASGKTTDIKLSYACPSDLAGTYNAVITRDDGSVYNRVSHITEESIGVYITDEVGGWGDLGVGIHGYRFTDVCNVLSVPHGNLADYYSNEIWSTDNGYVDEATGELHISYHVNGDGWESIYDCVYTPAK